MAASSRPGFWQRASTCAGGNACLDRPPGGANGGGTRACPLALLNNRGDLIFVGDLSSPSLGAAFACFMRIGTGRTTALSFGDSDARRRPYGGGGLYVSSYGLNRSGGAVFFAKLDTDDDKDGHGHRVRIHLARWESWSLVVRTAARFRAGTVTTVASGDGFSVNNNDLGQVATPVADRRWKDPPDHLPLRAGVEPPASITACQTARGMQPWRMPCYPAARTGSGRNG